MIQSFVNQTLMHQSFATFGKSQLFVRHPWQAGMYTGQSRTQPVCLVCSCGHVIQEPRDLQVQQGLHR